MLPRSILALLVAGLFWPAVTQASGPHSWVSGVGDDANPCSRTAPCKTFAGAISKTDARGTISVLDPGGFGGLTITKAITIDAGGVYAGVLVGGTTGITVNAGSAANVVLRGLTLDYAAPCATPGALNGIRFLSGRSLRIEDTTIHGFPGAGVDLQPSADGGSVTISRSRLSDNCTAGLVARRAAGSVRALLADSFVSNSATGVLAGAGATVQIARNAITGHATGLAAEAGGALESFGDNRVGGNVVDGAPTLDLNPPPVPPAPVTTTVTSITTVITEAAAGPAPAVKPGAVGHCTVPALTGRTLAQVRAALTKAGCRLGAVRHRRQGTRRRNRTTAQTVKAGTTLAQNAKVGITLNATKPKAKAKASVVGGATRTWVSGVGDDANPCSRTAPCKTFAGALAGTADGGTIDVLDAGSFGPLTIDAPVTIDGGGHPAGIEAAAGGSAITVNVPGGGGVTLRGLQLVNPGGCTAPGAGDGIRMLSGGVVHVEDVTMRGFAGSGVALQPGLDLRALIQGGTAAGNCAAGVSAQRPGGHVDVTVDGLTTSDNGTGVLAGDGAAIRLGDTTVNGNATGLATAGSGALAAWGDLHVLGNAAAGTTPAALAFR
jgi:hypothetical protein